MQARAFWPNRSYTNYCKVKWAKTNPNKIWKYINSKSKTRTGKGELCKDPLDKKSEKTEDGGEKANILADFISSAYSTDDDINPKLTKKR